jgi:hypothetical protein
LEDVIVGQTPEQPSRWYTESTVHSGVRALLKLDRCTEEESRLPMEARNMCEWFRRELMAVELALYDPGSTHSILGILWVLKTRIRSHRAPPASTKASKLA